MIINFDQPKQNLSLKDIKPISKCQNEIHQIYGRDIFCYSMKPKERIELARNHCVFNGYVQAFKEHRPITLSPDIVWILILQAFSNHIGNNSEKLRSMFVDFTGKKELIVRRENMTPSTATVEDWMSMFPEFVQQISQYVGKPVVDNLEPDFTTTTPITKAVGQLSIMSSFKDYFNYHVIMCACGFPYIVLEGTTEDWEKIRNKLEHLKQYDLQKWVETLLPIISKIIDTTKGNVDIQFWRNMIHIQPSEFAYSPGYTDGWFVNFFLYDIYGGLVGSRVYEDSPDLTDEILSIPFKLSIIGGGQDVHIDCEMLAGFIGTSQNPKNKSIKPEVGFIIRKEDKEAKARAQREIERKMNEAKNMDDIDTFCSRNLQNKFDSLH